MQEIIVPAWKDYELIDSGDGLRLERLGKYTLVRPDSNILWTKTKPDHPAWTNPDLRYTGRSHKGSWEGSTSLLEGWWISYGEMTLKVLPTQFGHIGVFPEQAGHWVWLDEVVHTLSDSKKKASVLNLFAYTGAASIVAAKAGATVCHVDASKASIYKAKENAAASDLPETAIRWIVEDALKFLRREVRRGNQYDIILMDPPVFGRGPKGEIWRLEAHIKELAELSRELLPKDGKLLVNVYATSLYPQSILRVFSQARFADSLQAGSLLIEETISKKSLPTGFFLRG